MKKDDILKFFKNQTASVNYNSGKFWPGQVERDWKVMVLIFAIGLAVLSFFAWDIYLSDKIAGGYFNQGVVSPINPIKILDKKRLQSDLYIMQAKDEAYLNLKNNQVRVPDPSI